MKNKIERDIKLTHDCAGEFTLPDYLPAVGKLLIAECSVVPDEVYLRENGAGITAELGGDVIFRVVWTADGASGADDAEKKPAAATFRCDYDTAALLGAVSPPRCRVTTSPESVFCRVTGPRKLSLRARLTSRVIAVTDSDVPTPEECCADDVEVLYATTEDADIIGGSARDLFASSELPAGSDSLYCRGDIGVTSCALSSPTEVRVDGDVILTCYTASDGGIMPSVMMIPFSETVPLDTSLGVDADSFVGCRAYGVVTSEDVRTEGETERIEIMYDLFVEVLTAKTSETVRDAYSCRGESVCTYETVEYISPVATVMGNVTVNERTDMAKTGKVEIMTGAASLEEAVVDRGRLRLSGELTGTALILRDGEYESVPWSVPWRYEVTAMLPDGITGEEKLLVWGEAKPLSLSGRADGALSVTAELAVSATVTKTSRASVVSALSVGTETKNKGGISVYYPLPGEDVWEVAKRFRVPTGRVSTAENVDENGKPLRVVII